MRLRAALGWVLAASLLVAGCADPRDPNDPSEIDDRYGVSEIEQRRVDEPVAFTDQNYDFTGETSIRDVLDLIAEEEFVWYGVSSESPYPVMGDCEPDRPGDQVVASLDELPATIEGVVTLHPRYFQKISVCGEDERNYGSFIMQDATGGILVLKDSRIADFTYGQRVRLKVRGLIKFFDTFAVLVHDGAEVIDEEQQSIYYEPGGGPEGSLERAFTESGDIGSEDNDIGKVLRIRGRVVQAPTNSNFNEAILCMLDRPCELSDGMLDNKWTVSFDRELGLRNVSVAEGQRVQLTGPVVNSFGVRMIVARLGQIEYIDDASQN